MHIITIAICKRNWSYIPQSHIVNGIPDGWRQLPKLLSLCLCNKLKQTLKYVSYSYVWRYLYEYVNTWTI